MGKNAIYGLRNRSYRVSRGGFRPTSASCIIKDEYGYDKQIGKCHRAEWYRLNGIKPTNPPSDKESLFQESPILSYGTTSWMQTVKLPRFIVIRLSVLK